MKNFGELNFCLQTRSVQSLTAHSFCGVVCDYVTPVLFLITKEIILLDIGMTSSGKMGKDFLNVLFRPF